VGQASRSGAKEWRHEREAATSAGPPAMITSCRLNFPNSDPMLDLQTPDSVKARVLSAATPGKRTKNDERKH